MANYLVVIDCSCIFFISLLLHLTNRFLYNCLELKVFSSLCYFWLVNFLIIEDDKFYKCYAHLSYKSCVFY